MITLQKTWKKLKICVTSWKNGILCSKKPCSISVPKDLIPIQKLSQQLKFWRQLSAKFDSLEYEFNDQKTKKIILLMNLNTRIKPQCASTLKQFQRLKDEVIGSTNPIKKLGICLQDSFSEKIKQFEECEWIMRSIDLLKQILVELRSLFQEHKILKERGIIVYKKIMINLIKKLLGINLCPTYLLSASKIKQNYLLLDQILSFFSHFISMMEQDIETYCEIIQKAEYNRQVIIGLLDVLNSYELLLKEKNQESIQFMKELKKLELDYNIFDDGNSEKWSEFMQSLRIIKSNYKQLAQQ